MVFGRIIFAALLLAAAPAFAQDKPTTKELCQQLTAYQPDANGGADYKPGVDAHGNAVAPADLDGPSPITLPEETHIAITLEQARSIGLPQDTPYYPQAFVGEVTVNNKTGDTYFNGKRLSQTQVQVLCKDQ